MRGQANSPSLYCGSEVSPELARYPGHVFFRSVMGLNAKSDRGKARQFAAQIAMLFLSRHEKGPEHYSDINAQAINEFYFSHVDFDRQSSKPERLVQILDKISALIGGGDHPKLKGHDAIHLVLLVDSLWDDYTRSWEANLGPALDKFLTNLAKAKATQDAAKPDEFWIRYGQWTRVNSDRGERIAHRHAFYLEKMLEYLAPLQMKDPRRIYGELERELIYFGNGKRCAVCDVAVPWNELEIHHLEQHAHGGRTDISNGAPVHKACHPKTEAATKKLAEKVYAQRAAPVSA